MGVDIKSSYTGIITQSGSVTVLIGTSGYKQAGGTFTGGTGAFTLNGGDFLLSGGTFTTTSGLTSVVVKSGSATWQKTGGTFSAPTGTVDFAGNITSPAITITGSSTFSTLIFDMLLGGIFQATISSGTTLTAPVALTIAGTGGDSANVELEGGGVIAASGNVGSLNTGADSGGGPTPATILINGTSTQSIGGSITPSVGAFPSITINKTSGTLNFLNTVSISGNWNYQAGTLNFGTSQVDFMGSLGSDPTADGFSISIKGSASFNDLMFDEAGGRAVVSVIDGGTTLTVNGTLTIAGSGGSYSTVALQGGTIEAKGNIISTNTSPGTGGGNNNPTTLLIDGTGSQTITGQSTLTVGGLPSLQINKPSGTLHFVNGVTVVGNWIYQSGALDFGTSTIDIASTYYADPGGDGFVVTIAGDTTFNNLMLDIGGAYRYFVPQVSTTSTIIVNGTLTFAGSGGDQSELDMENGTIIAKGDIYSTNTNIYSNQSDGAVGSVSLQGTSTQMIVGSGIQGAGSFPNLIINKNSGVAYASSTTDIVKLTVTKGELRLGPPTGATVFQINGNTVVSSGGTLSDYALAPSTVEFGGSISNSGSINFDGSNASCGSLDTVLIRSVGGTQRSWTGSGTFVMRDVDVADQGGTAAITVVNGTKTGTNINTNWSFVVGGQALLLQSATSTGGSGTSQLTLTLPNATRPADFIVVAESTRNQKPATPTDSSGNTYQLLASSTFGSSPTYGLALYYARNITETSSLVITANGASSLGSQMLSASAFEYTGVAPSSTVDNYSSHVDTSGSAVSLTSQSVSGQTSFELYFGGATIGSSATLSPGSGWGNSTALTNNSTLQALYTEDMDSTSTITAAATWSSSASTTYAAIMGVFKSPSLVGYMASGTLDSETFDTRVTTGVQLNSVTWQGVAPSSTAVGVQFAVSNSSSGPWNFKGPDGTSNTYFTGNPGASIPIIATDSGTSGYTLFNGYRYFRYRVILFASTGFAYSPTVSGITVNWSP
jgi:hypothetical protein